MIDQTDMDCELNVSIGEMLFHLESNYSADFSSFAGEEETKNCCCSESAQSSDGGVSIHYTARR